ncbi:thioredoxin (H-type,TRX-H) [Paramagnetospirillum caucaseum]|uniref:Thioredoxin (H-type,TRX-H) n=1 Tax=Paramagnetospirillum caucaseum TaxID=1244869 RepID=M3A6S3_9PROT|nr:thioredoxin family protein [Paramagnetospirillum caucaseum]EME68174.1 thioredoxin (H-type,TRX-H) [Paramagnetospirillum caucaseum]
MSRLLSRLTLLFALILAAPVAWSAQMWDKAAFEAAQAAGSPILVHVTAPWCPTCKAQKPTVDKLESSNPALRVFTVDFDSQKDVLMMLGVKSQSTLISYRGKAEVARSTGVTEPAAITGMVVKASH